MKKGFLILMCIISTSALAQNGFGVKAGLNYGDNGEIEFNDITQGGDTESKVGYHFGVFYKAELGMFFVKPELLYTQTKSSFEYDNEDADYSVSKLDLPILLGLDLLGPVNIFAGPSLQYILDNDFQGVTVGDVENKFTVGAQFGAGVQLGGIGIDARYERGLSENEAEVLDLNDPSGVERIDSRPSQFILSLSINL